MDNYDPGVTSDLTRLYKKVNFRVNAIMIEKMRRRNALSKYLECSESCKTGLVYGLNLLTTRTTWTQVQQQCKFYYYY